MPANIWKGTTDSNWGTATNWSLGAVPTAVDGNPATFDITSPNCTVNTSNRVCSGLDFTGYLNTLTMTFNITVTGAITFQLLQSSRIAGAGTLLINETATITSNSGTWPNPFTFGGTNKTTTLADNMTVTGLVTLNYGTAGILNGNILIAQTSVLGSNVATTGTTTINMTGTGTLQTTGTGIIRISLTIKSTASVTLGATLNYGTGTFTVEASAVVVTSGNSLVLSTSCTLNTSVMGATTNAWVNINSSASGNTITLTSDLYGTGTLQSGASTTTTWSGAFNINWRGTVTIGTNWSGAATLVLINTTTIGGGIINNNMTWSSGAITSTGFTYRTGTWTISSGVTVPSSTGTITLNTTPTFTNNASALVFNTIAIGGGTTVINGTNGFTVGSFSYIGAATNSLSLKSGNTYIITTAFSTTTATASIPWNIISSTGGVQAILTVNSGASQNIGFVNATDIDSSAGQTIQDFRGTLSNATNWANMTAASMQSAYTFIM